MLPKPHGNYGRAIVTALFGILLLIPIGAATYRYRTGTGNTIYDPYDGGIVILLALVLLFVAGFIIPQLISSEHALQAAERSDDRIAPPILIQPDAKQALRYGEQLALVRTSTLRSFVNHILFTTILSIACIPMIVYFGEVVVFLADPNALNWIDVPLIKPRAIQPRTLPPPLTAFEWVALLLPVLLWLAVVTILIIESGGRRQVISADESSISLHDGPLVRRFMRWDEVRTFLRVGSRYPSEEIYWLRGARRGLILNFTIPTSKPMSDPLHLSEFAYDGGAEQYEQQLQRLLATIVVRGHIPLRVFAHGYYERSSNVVRSTDGLTLDEMLTMPLARAPYQPSAQAVERAAKAEANVDLKERLPRRPVFRSAVWITLAYGAILVIVTTAASLLGPNRQRNLSSPSGIAFLLLGLCVLYFPCIFLAAIFYRNSHPSVAADGSGISTFGASDKTIEALVWEDIRAWGVIPPNPLSPNSAALYAIFTDSKTMQWNEPADA